MGSSAAFSVALSGIDRAETRFLGCPLTRWGELEFCCGHPHEQFEGNFIWGEGKSVDNDKFLTILNGWAYAAEVVIHMPLAAWTTPRAVSVELSSISAAGQL